MNTEPKEIFVETKDELPGVVEQLLLFAGNRRKFALSGDLGAGKTTFTQAFCRHFKVKEQVTSPTFALVNQYTYTDGKGKEQLIHHLDLYRLKSLQEALDIGIEDYLYDENYCLIEWPEIVEGILPDDVVRINISISQSSARKILFL